MKVYLSVALLISFVQPCAAASPSAVLAQARPGPQAEQQKQKRPAPKQGSVGTEESVNDELVKAQAVAALKEVVESSSSIAKLEERALVVSGAAELLWRHDEQYARAAFSKLIDELISLFESQSGAPKREGAGASEITAALNVSLKALARRDPALASQVLERYQSLREDAVKGSPSNRILSERFSLAKESVDINVQQSASLAAKVIEFRVPGSFPQYLYDLAGQDRAAADSLYRKSLAALSSARSYGVNDAILLSAYGFKEKMVLIPTPARRASQGAKNEFGVFTTALNSAGDKPDRVLTDEYLRAAYVFLTSQIQPGSPKMTEPAFLGPSFFLARKLRAYASKLGGDAQGKWQQLEYGIGVLARNAGMDQSTLDYLGGFADRLVADNNVFQFDGGASAFERASKTEDKEQRTRYLVKGIWNLLQDSKFTEAEERIKDVEDSGLKERLNDLLNYEAGEAAVGRAEWNEGTLRSLRIKDPQIRLLLLLNGARAAISGGARSRAVALQYLNEALPLASKVENTEARAKGLMCIASLLSSVDVQRAREVLTDAKNELNRSKAYDREGFVIDVNLPGTVVQIGLTDSTLDACLKRVARTDWAAVKALIEELDSASVRSIAQIAICRAVL